MMLPERVLLSNAPPLLDADGLHSASRVLQEHSGNRQHTDFSYGGDYDLKYQASVFNENSYIPQHQPQTQPQQLITQQLHHSQPQHRQQWKYGLQRNGYSGYAFLDHTKIQVEADYLYRRFKQSEAYVKYRARQTKDDKGNDDQKWPEHLEKAFFRALVTWIPMGRRKEWWKEKQRGRNELIADCIEELTGEQRTRKQVSSHIQVLKPFVENDPYIMRYLSKEDLSQRGRHAHGAAYGAGRRTSSYPVTSLPHSARAAMPSIADANSYYSVSKLKQDSDVIEPVEFQMFIQQKHAVSEDQDEVQPRRLHTYTRSVENPSKPDLHLQDWQTISRDFPLLAKMNSQGKLDCKVIVAEASLAFPMTMYKEQDGTTIPGVELGISFLCSSRRFSPTTKDAQVRYHNTFYEGGSIVGDPQRCDVRFGPSDRPNCNGVVDTQIKFGSTFWARTLGSMANQLLSISKNWGEEVSSQIRSITVLQEMFLVSNGQYDRLLVIHWTFRHSTREQGGASWRKLVLPPNLTCQYPRPGDCVKHGAYTPAARQDSFLEWNCQYVDDGAAHTQKQHSLPALQSPFEYESSSGSALSSATWPTSASEGSFTVAQNNHLDFAGDNAFDFNAGNININFDSTAFDFDRTADFPADPALEAYSHTWAEPSSAVSFDAQLHSAVEDANFLPSQSDYDAQAAMYNGAFDAQHPYHTLPEQQEYASATPDQQAYGGAGQDLDQMSSKDDDPLVALANASFMAGAVGEKTGEEFYTLDEADDVL